MAGPGYGEVRDRRPPPGSAEGQDHHQGERDLPRQVFFHLRRDDDTLPPDPPNQVRREDGLREGAKMRPKPGKLPEAGIGFTELRNICPQFIYG